MQAALAAVGEGGYAEALARVGYLLARKGEPLLLSSLELKEAFIAEHRDLLPAIPRDQWRRIRGEQEIIVRYAPEEAMATLPKLLHDPRDRERLRTLLSRIATDERIRRTKPTPAQIAMHEELSEALAVPAARARAASRRGARRVRRGAASQADCADAARGAPDETQQRRRP